jgi:hypothetical protein
MCRIKKEGGVKMKKLIVTLICFVFLSGCSYHMKYAMPQGKTLSDFEQQKIDCGIDKIDRGSFMFGPAILVGAVVGIEAIVKRHQNKKFQDCMEKAGYKCIDDCPRGE